MRRAITFLLIGLLATSLLVAQGSADDDRIYDAVRQRLAVDPDVKGGAIDVTVTDGLVTLKGRVRDQNAKEKATRITKRVKGVKSVDNQLKLFSEN
jgi:hyperosmotically inducible protein